jgi:ATP-dependent Clp protease ATP-binding subunit ClpC
MFENYGINTAVLFKKAEDYRRELKHPYVGSEHLLLAILDNENEVSNCLKKYGLTFDVFKKELLNIVGSATKETNFILYTPLLKRIIENATNDAIDNNDGKVTIRHLFVSMLDEGEGIAIRIMLGLGIDLNSLYDEFKFSLINKSSNKLEVLEIGDCLNNHNCFDKVVGRDEEINLVIETLMRKNKSNPLLVGPSGVGKTAIISELARRINAGLVPNELLNKKIVSLDMGSLVSGTKYRGEFEERLTKIIKEVLESKNIILFIDEIHTMVNAGGAEGAINASDILKPYLARGELKCIGATTTDEYYKSIHKDKALDRRFYTILIKEPSLEETKNILQEISSSYEKHHNIKISDKNIDDIIYLADKYITNKNNPDKSIDILDMVCSSKKIESISFSKIDKINNELIKLRNKKNNYIYQDNYEQASICKSKENEYIEKIDKLKNNYNKEITYDDILKVIAKKTNIPLLENKKEVFNNIKKNLTYEIKGQDKALNKILKNIWLKLNGMDMPLSLLLIGPSGVGKTKTVKIISDSIKNSKLIRLDMSEYNLDTSVNKLIGVSAGYVGYDDSYVFRSVIDNPYSIILVDEIEKAHPRVLNLFLQILDEGFITNASGEKIDFKKTLIFMTSNVINKKGVGFINSTNNNLIECFSKEFLGRFTDIVSYDYLSDEVLDEYIKIYLKNNKISREEIKKEAECSLYGLRNLQHLINKYNSELDIEIPL